MNGRYSAIILVAAAGRALSAIFAEKSLKLLPCYSVLIINICKNNFIVGYRNILVAVSFSEFVQKVFLRQN